MNNFDCDQVRKAHDDVGIRVDTIKMLAAREVIRPGSSTMLQMLRVAEQDAHNLEMAAKKAEHPECIGKSACQAALNQPAPEAPQTPYL